MLSGLVVQSCSSYSSRDLLQDSPLITADQQAVSFVEAWQSNYGRVSSYFSYDYVMSSSKAPLSIISSSYQSLPIGVACKVLCNPLDCVCVCGWGHPDHLVDYLLVDLDPP